MSKKSVSVRSKRKAPSTGLTVGDGQLTMKELADLANTSTATISRVLSNKPGVSDAKRATLEELIRRLGYAPNRNAQSLARQKSHVVGFIAADLRNAAYVSFFRHIQAAPELAGYHVLMGDSAHELAREETIVRSMRQQQAEGLLIFPLHDWDESTPIDHLLELKLQKFPFVILGHIDQGHFDCVTSEEKGTAKALARHLIDLGHRRIAFVGRNDSNRCIRERLEGLREGLEEAGLSLPEDHIIDLRDGWPVELIALLRAHDRPTAVMFVNDTLALIGWHPLTAAGFRIPTDLSVVSFGDNLWSEHLHPALTTTCENVEEISRIAVRMLMERTANPLLPRRVELVPQRIVLRKSTAPPVG